MLLLLSSARDLLYGKADILLFNPGCCMWYKCTALVYDWVEPVTTRYNSYLSFVCVELLTTRYGSLVWYLLYGISVDRVAR